MSTDTTGEDFGSGIFDEPDRLGRYSIDPDMCRPEEGDPYDYPAELDDEEHCQPIGCCEECECDVFEDDVCVIDDELVRLCGHCAWIAAGCPEPGESDDEDNQPQETETRPH